MREIKALQAALAPFRWRLALLIVITLLAAVAQTAVIVTIVQSSVAIAKDVQVVELGVGPLFSRRLSVANALGSGAVALAALLGMTYFTARQGARLAGSILSAERRRYLKLFLDAPMIQQRATGSGSFQEMLTAFTQKHAQLAVVGVSLIVCSLNLLILVGAAVVVSPVAGIGIVVGAGLLSLAARPLATMRRRLARRQVISNLAFASAANEVYRAGREIRTFGVRPTMEARLEHLNTDVARNYEGLVFLTRFAPSAFQFAGFGLLIAALAVLTQMSAAEAAGLGSSLVLVLRAFTYAQGMQAALNALGEAAPYGERIFQQTAAWVSEPSSFEAEPFPYFQEIALEGAFFGHGSGDLILRNVSLSIKKGEVVGVAGPSGSGKSTIAMLLMRLWEPSQGSVTVNGVPAARIMKEEYYRNVALVPQDPVLVEGTVRENVAFFRETVSSADVEDALMAAGLGDIVRDLRDGAETRIDADGSGLSGGQRQRLCLARALAGRPAIIVLDEPTSALDGASAESVIEALAGLRGETTLVVISHQEAVLRLCDRVISIQSSTSPSATSLDEKTKGVLGAAAAP